MKVLETRVRKDGLKYRRREDGSWTVEVPVEIWRRLNNQGRQRNRIEQAQRAIERDRLVRQAEAHARMGWKAIASAHELGVPLRTVERWRKAARDNSQHPEAAPGRAQR